MGSIGADRRNQAMIDMRPMKDRNVALGLDLRKPSTRRNGRHRKREQHRRRGEARPLASREAGTIDVASQTIGARLRLSAIPSQAVPMARISPVIR